MVDPEITRAIVAQVEELTETLVKRNAEIERSRERERLLRQSLSGARAMADHYRAALERVESHGSGGAVRIAREALSLTGTSEEDSASKCAEYYKGCLTPEWDADR